MEGGEQESKCGCVTDGEWCLTNKIWMQRRAEKLKFILFRLENKRDGKTGEQTSEQTPSHARAAQFDALSLSLCLSLSRPALSRHYHGFPLIASPGDITREKEWAHRSLFAS